VTTWRRRVADFFALESDWVRQPPAAARRRDATVALVLFALSAIGLEMLRSGGGLRTAAPVWQEYLGLAAMAAPIAFRRRWPLGVVVVSSLAFFVVGVRMPDVAMQLSVQGLYFFALFSAMAWARDRRVALVVIAGVLLLMFGWLAYQFLLGSAVAQINEDIADPTRSRGAVNPVIAAVTNTFLVNIAYFGGAVLGGQAAWNAARRRARLATQAATLRTQAAELKEHAVVEERLRIARELHDVVAHHVSVMGVQAAAARRVLDVDPQAASSALSSVESSAREAVTEMRALLGTLRQGDRAAAESGRAPEPSVDALPGLVDQLRADGLDVTYSVVADPADAATHLGPAVGLTLYRTVQEALHNVRRHSTATAATVVLRVDGSPSGGFAEVEVLDSGRPRTGTSGTGLGLLGMRERVASLDGSLEIGPRATGGFRVRVRLPLARRTSPTAATAEDGADRAEHLEPVEARDPARTAQPVESAR
jgi:signal transduction histidine kinase